MKFIASFLFLLASLLFAGAVWWLQQPLGLKTETVELTVEPGSSARAVVRSLVQGGV